MEDQTFIFFVLLCIITHIVRTVYEVLKHKKRLEPSKLSFVIVFINMAILWISWIALCSKDIYKIEMPDILQYFGLLICIIGLIFFITALFTIKTLEIYEGDLIKKGIYSKIRHPMYLGFILWLIGFPIYFEAILSGVLALILIGNVLYWRYLEEMELVERFPDYKFYKTITLF